MKTVSSRKGSALLIVLGMLAFMVVSAVSFSAYMRSSRLPSSYLRRTAAARQLAKAALAEAIERVDVAIGENAYPDQRVGNAMPNATRLQGIRGETSLVRRNYWYNNVFIGGDTFLSPDDTVSTLTLEGLAYIPPPLVNEARRYSRLSHAATWHTLGFDAGRYAYCAIDVSDCLDMNRLVADGRRNSGRRRITMAHLLEDRSHSSYANSPSSWETFMSRFRTKNNEEDDADKGIIDENKVPLISLADWNLAVYNAGSSGMTSPFCDYLTGASSSGFYGLSQNTGEKADKIRSMRVVTDSLLSRLTEKQLKDDDLLDLATEAGQPFRASDFSDATKLDTIFTDMENKGTDAFKRLMQGFLSKLELACLYDYLDENNVPISLAIPTTERVPMVCAITPDVNTTLNGVEEQRGDDVTLESGDIERTLDYKLNGDLIGNGKITTLIAFPFRRGADDRDDDFTYEACLRLFFTPASRTFSSFRMGGAGDAIRPTNADFNDTGYADGVFKIALDSGDAPDFSKIQDEKGAVKSLEFIVPAKARAEIKKLLQPVFSVTAVFSQDESGALALSKIKEAVCNVVPLGEDGRPMSDYSGDKFLEIVQSDDADLLVPHVAVFVRVKNSEGKTVDLVPAGVIDDKRYNEIDNGYWSVGLDSTKNAPLLRFDGNSENAIAFTIDGFKKNFAVKYSPDGLMCPDPRFNHAPENWITTVADDANTWLNNCGAADRDGDIFMTVSDQEYLQSVYELAFLPNLSELARKNDSERGAYKITERAEYPTKVEECTNGSLMWNTYRCYDTTGATRHDFEEIGLVQNDSSFKVNPCSQSIDSLMAAFANTPYDWWAASTNNVDIPKSDLNSASTFNKKYAFSAMNTKDKIEWDDLKQIATKFRDAVRANNGDWEAAFDSLDWGGDESDFCGVDASSLQKLSASSSMASGTIRSPTASTCSSSSSAQSPR